jgi:hypothetical protein
MNEKYRGYDIKIEQDKFPESPRDWENLGTMICFHRRYNLGDKHSFDDPDDFKELLKDCIYLPLYLFDHSGITMSTTPFSCSWDSGQVGLIYVEIEQVKKEWDWEKLSEKRIEKIKEILIQEVETYDDYLTGNIWCFTIEKDGGHIDSRSGVFGDPDGYIMDKCRGIIDYNIKKEKEKHVENLKNQIRNNVPLIYRSVLWLKKKH